MAAVKATLAGLPFSTNRRWKAAMALSPRVAAKVAMYRTERTSARPPHIIRRPRWKPLSRLNGANPTSAAISPQMFSRRQNFDQITATSGIQIIHGTHHHQFPSSPPAYTSMVKADAEQASSADPLFGSAALEHLIRQKPRTLHHRSALLAS